MWTVKERANNETYHIWDVEGDEVVMSRTILRCMKSTKGHAHPHEEIYHFVSGSGVMEIDHVPWSVDPGRFKIIHPNQHHRVFNMTGEELVFVCCWRAPQ